MTKRLTLCVLGLLLLAWALPALAQSGQEQPLTPIGDQVRFFGDVHIPSGRVANTAVAILGNVLVDGVVRDSAVAILGTTTVSGRVDGEAVAILGDVRLLPGAHIGGQAVSVGGTVHEPPGSSIRGGIVSLPFTRLFKDGLLRFNGYRFGRHPVLPFFGLKLWAFVSALAVALLVAVLFPAGISRCAKVIKGHPGRSLAAGFTGYSVSFVALLVVALTILGIPLAMLGGLLVWAAGRFGFTAVALALGTAVRGQSEPQTETGSILLSVTIGVALLSLVGLVPLAGWLISLTAMLFAFGGVVLSKFGSVDTPAW